MKNLILMFSVVLCLFTIFLPAGIYGDTTTSGQALELGKTEIDSEGASFDSVSTLEELEKWFEEHETSGGQVYFDANITLTRPLTSYSDASFTVDTGRYGLIYDGGFLDMPNLEIMGQGVDVPVLDVKHIEVFRMNWVHMVQTLKVTAWGRDGAGGCAMRISQTAPGPVYFDYFIEEGLIRSYGTGAIGLYVVAPADIYCLNIETEGVNSIAVYGEQDVNLYYCKLNSRGDGAKVAAGPGHILLDTCAASPPPANASVIKRQIADISGGRFYLPVKAHENIYGINSLYTFLLKSSDGSSPAYQSFNVNWDNALYGIDTSILGRTLIPGSLYPPFSGLGLDSAYPLELIVDVRDADLPCISELFFADDAETGTYAILNFWDTYDPSEQNIILWRSEDGGARWYDFTNSSEIEWLGDRVLFKYKEITGEILLQLEIPGKGESNVVTLYPIDSSVSGGCGGRRDGSDRTVVFPPGWSNPSSTQPVSEDSPDVKENDREEPTPPTLRQPLLSAFFNLPKANQGQGSSSEPGDEYTENNGEMEEPIVYIREWEDETSLAVSGKRLSYMAAVNPVSVPFVKQDIQILIPSDSLIDLNLPEDNLFFIQIMKLSENSFSVVCEASGNNIVNLPFQVRLRESTFPKISLPEAVCLDSRNESLPVSYDSLSGWLTVFSSGPGIFSLKNSLKSPDITDTSVGFSEQGENLPAKQDSFEQVEHLSAEPDSAEEKKDLPPDNNAGLPEYETEKQPPPAPKESASLPAKASEAYSPAYITLPKESKKQTKGINPNEIALFAACTLMFSGAALCPAIRKRLK